MRLFEERRLHFTSWAVGLALKRNPEAGQAMAEAGHEVASHVWRGSTIAACRRPRSASTSV